MHLTSWRACAALLACLSLACAQRSKVVQVSVQAPWAGAPLILEASEYFTGSTFWSFAENLASGSLKLSDRDQHESALLLAEKLYSPVHRSSLQFALALRNYAPTMELHRQLWSSAESSGCKIEDDEGAAVLIGGRCLTKVDEIQEATETCTKANSGMGSYHEGVDHIYPNNAPVETNVPIAILYATLGTETFHKFHDALSKMVQSGSVRYIFRHTWSAWRNSTFMEKRQGLDLQGYGVELAIKNMEYKAVDDSKVGSSGEVAGEVIEEGDVGGFDFKTLYTRRPELVNELQSFRDTLLAEVSKTDENVKVWTLKDLGIQASQRIMEAKEPLRLMRDLSHNLPTLVSSLSRLKVNMSIKSEIEGNHQFLEPGTNLVLLNGRQIDPETTTPFGLLSVLRHEVEVMEKLTALGLSYSSARKLLVAPDKERAAKMMGQPQSFKIDVMHPDHVFWLNDLERDSAYRQWPRNLEALLQRGWPGQIRHVAKNLYTAIYLLDPADKNSGRLVREAFDHIQNNFPVRFGVIFKSNSALQEQDEANAVNVNVETPEQKEGRELYNLFMALNERHGKDAAFAFWKQYDGKISQAPGSERAEEFRKDAFRAAIKAHKAKERDSEGKLKRAKYKSALNTTDYVDHLRNSSQFVKNSGLPLDEPILVVNGVILQGPGLAFDNLLMNVQTQMAMLQRMIYFGELHEKKSVYEQIVSDKAYKRYHKLIVPGTDTSKSFLSLGSVKLQHIPFVDCGADTGSMRAISTVVAVDLTKREGRKLLLDGFERLTHKDSATCKNVRMAFLHNGNLPDQEPDAALSSKLSDAIEGLSVIQMATAKWRNKGEKLYKLAKTVVGALDGKWEDIKKSNEDVKSLLERVQKAKDNSAQNLTTPGYITANEQVAWVRAAMDLSTGELGVSCAGRIFKVSSDVPFISGDFELAEDTEWKARAEHVRSVIDTATFDSVPAEDVTIEFMSDLSLVGAVILGEQSKKEIFRQELPRQWRGQLTGFNLGHENTALHVTAIVDPLCLATQRLAPMLMTVASGFNASVQVLLNPLADVTQLPIKGYFRYVLHPSLDFDELSGQLRTNHRASFTTLPLNKLLSMVLHPPDAWFVEAAACEHDMDNILLEKLPDHESVLSATYSLEQILVTGHCAEERGAPPAGLQLVLQDAHPGRPVFSDTIVMSNLGYFQLKARPGVWHLQAAEGRSRRLYHLKREEEVSDQRLIAVTSFEPEPFSLIVQKRAGMESEVLLQDGGADGGGGGAGGNPSIWNSFSNLFGDGGSGGSVGGGFDPKVRSNETIHVFSLASGHLYERFLRIMILSVVRNTKANVKFWLLSNFLSPKFKNFIPKMSRKFGFEYELVTYKWPAWLHRQTEKQRIIWGYKILMLDVLFPLNVPKIIYIDSDQVVRADLRELWHMDLRGRALAYTPFCDSNREMEGYRFWKQGFWSSHLGSLKYHISALYVVDLVQFRQQGAGDQLRVIYSQLSRDPNSLANLDQDLPNYAQHTVPIQSLPQEWLWCETWCSNETKPIAKTIDLCNNPMTKEPKLEQARRIITEWTELDDAVKAVEIEAEEAPALAGGKYH